MNCEDMPDIGWTLHYTNQCYFYPARDCPGWVPGIRCGRIGDEIPLPETGEEFDYHDFERASASFVLEVETWPVFIEWMKKQSISAEAISWARSNPDPEEFRRDWIVHMKPPQLAERVLSAYDEATRDELARRVERATADRTETFGQE